TSPDIAGKARLQLKDKTPNTGDEVVWKYGGGDAVDFVNAIQDFNSVAFCVYDDSGIVVRAEVPGNLLCNRAFCWRTNSAFSVTTFKDKLGVAYGIQSIKSNTAVSPAGKALVKGTGQNLVFVPPPWTGTVTAELTMSDESGCYTTTFTAPTKNLPGTYTAKGN